MSKYTDMSNELLKLIGGKDNVASVTHCATRLRIRLHDEDNVPVEEIKKLPGVLGLQKNVGEIQVIIGPAVDDAYQEFMKLGGFETKAPKKTAPAQKREKGFKAVLNTLFSAMTGCISPIVYAFVVMGMFKSISAIFGPSLLGLFTAESDVYVLLEGIGNAITYFLPFLLAYSASQKLGANTVISIAMAAIMLSPAMTGVVAAGEPFKVFGLFPMTLINYSSTFLPILLIVAVQAYAEKLLNKIIPNVLKTVFVPTLTVAIMTVLGLCVLGPIGQWLGDGLAAIVMLLSTHASWLEGALVAALYVFMVAFGLGGPVFLATFAVYTQTGSDGLYLSLIHICVALHRLEVTVRLQKLVGGTEVPQTVEHDLFKLWMLGSPQAVPFRQQLRCNGQAVRQPEQLPAVAVFLRGVLLVLLQLFKLCQQFFLYPMQTVMRLSRYGACLLYTSRCV